MGTAVGVIGLGNLGGAMAQNLLAAGFEVVGLDINSERMASFTAQGGKPAASSGEVTREAEIVLLSLPTVAALEHVVQGHGGLVETGRAGVICVETGTFPLSAKIAAASALADRGIALLDCTVSGTGTQARDRDIVLYASGPVDLVAQCEPVFAAISRAAPWVGDFGAGSIMKFVSNLLVAIHTVAAAEALTLADKCGLNLGATLDLVSAGAGNSRMLEVRGPLMVASHYDVASATLDTLTKDTKIIRDFAEEQGCIVPMLSMAAVLLNAASAQGHHDLDPAVVKEVLSGLAGLATAVGSERE